MENMFKQTAFNLGKLHKEAAMSPVSLKKLRGELGWTQSQMGEYLGVEDSTISQWERHRVTRNTTKRLEAVAKFKKLKRAVAEGYIPKPPVQMEMVVKPRKVDRFYQMLALPLVMGIALIIILLLVGR